MVTVQATSSVCSQTTLGTDSRSQKGKSYEGLSSLVRLVRWALGVSLVREEIFRLEFESPLRVSDCMWVFERFVGLLELSLALSSFIILSR